MKSALQRIGRLYREMGPGERRIADYIVKNTSEVITLSVTELATKCNSGEATIVRFSKRIGFEGYQELKVILARELGSKSVLSEEIKKDDTCFNILCKQIADISLCLRETQEIIDPEKLEEATSRIMDASRIVVFGLGNSASIAMDAAHKFMRLGLDAVSCSDNHMQAIIASHLTGDAVAIGISHSGSSKDVVEALEMAKINGAFTIAITNYDHSPIMETADITLFTKAEETNRSILGLTSRIAALAIIDAIYASIEVRSSEHSSQAVFNTEAALKAKKY